MVSRKGITKAVKHDLDVAGHDVKVAGKDAGHDLKVAGRDAEKGLKAAGRDIKKAGSKVRKKL